VDDVPRAFTPSADVMHISLALEFVFPGMKLRAQSDGKYAAPYDAVGKNAGTD